MVVNIKENRVKFGDVAIGDVVLWGMDYYMKFGVIDNKVFCKDYQVNALHLLTGMAIEIKPDTLVRCVDAEMMVERG